MRSRDRGEVEDADAFLGCLRPAPTASDLLAGERAGAVIAVIGLLCAAAGVVKDRANDSAFSFLNLSPTAIANEDCLPGHYATPFRPPNKPIQCTESDEKTSGSRPLMCQWRSRSPHWWPRKIPAPTLLVALPPNSDAPRP